MYKAYTTFLLLLCTILATPQLYACTEQAPHNSQPTQQNMQQYVMFKVSPENAVIEINGQTLTAVNGTATIRLPFGTYSYRVSANGYNTKKGEINVSNPDSKHILNIELHGYYADITVQTDNYEDGLEIWIDDKFVGMTPYIGHVDYGQHTIECHKNGCATTYRKVNVTEEKTSVIINSPVQLYGMLDIQSTPDDAKVYIDGSYVGTTPLFLNKITAGEHSYRIERDEYYEITGYINIKENKTENIEAVLPEKKKYDNSHVRTLPEGMPQTPSGEEPFVNVEQMPSFPGGIGAMMQYINSHIKYPPQAQENYIQGKVIVRFVVDASGKIGQAKVIRGVDPSLDKEAVRLINSMPSWIPGKQNGVAVDTYYTIPVVFRI